MGKAVTIAFSTNLKPLIEHSVSQRLLQLVGQAEGKAYMVGGAVRDYCLTGSVPSDLDFMVTDCDAAELATRFADSQRRHCIVLDDGWGIYRIVLDDGTSVDIAMALDNDLFTDLARRDITINAMAVDLQTAQLIDPLNGLKDLDDRNIAMVSSKNLADDPLRMLRVFRIAAHVKASTIEPSTLQAVQQYRESIWNVAGERIQYEFLRFLSLPDCFLYLRQMADCGLLESLIPDLTPMKTIGASGFHHLGLFDHTLELVKQAELLVKKCPKGLQDWVEKPVSGSYTRFGLIKLSCLLHDVGKPATMGSRPDPVHGTRLTFYGHEVVGSEMAQPLLNQLKVSKDIRLFVTKLIRWHLYPCQFGLQSAEKSVLRFFRKIGDETLDLLLLALADRYSSCGTWVSDEDLKEAEVSHLWLMERYLSLKPIFSLPALLNGNDVMRLLCLKPGPRIKTILSQLQELQQLGKLSTVEEAESWLLENSETV